MKTRRSKVTELARARALVSSGAARSVRLAAGLSLGEVARHLECSTATVWRWEHLERIPRGDLALRYLALLDDLMGAR